jgi:hypothetical protein
VIVACPPPKVCDHAWERIVERGASGDRRGDRKGLKQDHHSDNAQDEKRSEKRQTGAHIGYARDIRYRGIHNRQQERQDPVNNHGHNRVLDTGAQPSGKERRGKIE